MESNDKKMMEKAKLELQESTELIQEKLAHVSSFYCDISDDINSVPAMFGFTVGVVRMSIGFWEALVQKMTENNGEEEKPEIMASLYSTLFFSEKDFKVIPVKENQD